MVSEQFELCGGTVMGTDHLQSHKPNQDAYHHLVHPDLIVGIVCDGCGDPNSPYSEVGARLISRATVAQTLLYAYGGEHILFDAIHNKIVQFINSNAVVLSSVPLNLELDALSDDLSERLAKAKKKAITDHFLCTVVGFAITTLRAYFFCIGDGTIFVNGKEYPIGPFPENTPPYIAYSLLDSSLITISPELLKFKIVHSCPTSELESFLIGSDGTQDIIRQSGVLTPDGKQYVGPIDQFWLDNRYYSNREAVNRKLTIINKPKQTVDWDARVVRTQKGLLHDDTTLLAGRRKCTSL